jgi:hypothetical protein
MGKAFNISLAAFAATGFVFQTVLPLFEAVGLTTEP